MLYEILKVVLIFIIIIFLSPLTDFFIVDRLFKKIDRERGKNGFCN